MVLLSARDCIAADGALITQCMVELGHWPQRGPECPETNCLGKLRIATEKGRFRWQCPYVSTCHCPRVSVLAGTAWYSDHGATNARRVATIVLAHEEGMAATSIASLAGVSQSVVATVLGRVQSTNPLISLDEDVALDVAPTGAKEADDEEKHLETAQSEVSDSDLSSCNEELSDFESVGTPSGAAVHFECSRYRAHASHVPEDVVQAAEGFMTAHLFKDRRLFLSCLYFLMLLLARQPRAFVDYSSDAGSASQLNLLGKLSHAPALHHHVVQQCLRQGLLPAYDAKARGRSVRALEIHVAVYGAAAPVCEATLTAWCLLHEVFRYPGSPHFLQDSLFEEVMLGITTSVLQAGMTEDNAASVISYVQQTLQMFIELRTDMASVFARGDGRQQLLRGRRPSKHARVQRILDHVLDALPTWRRPCLKTGQVLWEFIGLLDTLNNEEDVVKFWPQLCQSLEGLMDSMLEWPLMGRPTVGPTTPFVQRISGSLDESGWLFQKKS